jgi:AraC-like DNA-binding protein
VFGWLREERLRQANSQVSGTQTPFSVLSEALGYSTPANFSKAFRQRFGCSPSEMRAQLQGTVAAEQEPDSGLNGRSATAIDPGHDRSAPQPQGADLAWR